MACRPRRALPHPPPRPYAPAIAPHAAPLLAPTPPRSCGGRQAVDAFFARHQDLAHYHRPMAGPICYPAFKGEKLTAKDVMAYARALVAATGVLLLPGSACYDVDAPEGGGAHFRVGLGRLDIAENLAVYEAALKDSTLRPVHR